MQRATYSRRYRREPDTPLRNVLVCSVCHFPGVPADMTSGEHLGATPVEITGTVYVGPRADSDIRTFDKQIMPLTPRGTCPACGAEMYLTGKRGSGNRVP